MNGPYWLGEVEFLLANGTRHKYAWSWSFKGRGKRPSTGRVVAAGRDEMRQRRVPGRSRVIQIKVQVDLPSEVKK